MSNAAKEWIEVRQNIRPAIVVLSYVVSVIGSFTTLELLQRRTARQGSLNWLLLFGASLSMGGCGIWSMHFIGNNALILGDGVNTVQLIYAPGYTVASLIVAVVCVGVAFYFVGSAESVSLTRVGLVGILAGFGIPSMHYVGQFAIIHYRIRYELSLVIASFFIGITALSVALIIFFYLESQWKDRWHKRFGCALIMGIAVCGMHYVGMSATHYWTNGVNNSTDFMTTLSPSVLVGCIAGIATLVCLGLLSLTIVAQRRALKVKSQVKKIVLSCVYFDDAGRVLVTNDGMLPMRTIDSEFYQQGMEAELTPAHPVFQFLFRTSWSWRSFSYELSQIKREDMKESNRVFLERFHATALRLAEDLDIQLCDSGILHDQMITTGVLPSVGRRFKWWDGEKGLYPHSAFSLVDGGRGQMLFLVRRLSPSGTRGPGPDHFTSRGFRFGPPDIIARTAGTQLHVPSADIMKLFQGMHSYITHGISSPEYLPGRVFVGAFVVWPTLTGGLHILADAANGACVPAVEILPPDFEESGRALDAIHELNFLIQTLQGLNMRDAVKILRNSQQLTLYLQSAFANAGDPTSQSRIRLRVLFAYSTSLSIEKLERQIGDPLIASEAVLHPEIVPYGNSHAILFKAIVPLHHTVNSSQLSTDRIKVMPFSIFQAHHELISRHREEIFNGLPVKASEGEMNPWLRESAFHDPAGQLNSSTNEDILAATPTPFSYDTHPPTHPKSISIFQYTPDFQTEKRGSKLRSIRKSAALKTEDNHDDPWFLGVLKTLV
ncbi:uncharacterized protein VTP21DRAFT_3697 [Calcarisporiella thermophila]|uniref:uncharacterized protein n=1 Tax=Calcarisporiella thermophila TaxID=911321 RepID=UPI003741EBAD